MDIDKLIKRYEKFQRKSNDRKEYYNNRKDLLDKNGYWSMGYYAGRASLYEDCIDDLKELKESTKNV